MAAYLTASSLRRPVVLKLSDLHFGDDVVLSLLDDVLEEVHHSPVLVVATARSSLLERWAPRPGRHNHLSLHLDPLSRSATGELLEALSGRVVLAQVVVAFHTRSGGNPFYVEELVALLDGQGPPPGSHDHDVLDGPGGLGSAGGEDDDGPGMAITRAVAFPETLPDNLRGLVAARLDDLDVGPRSVLQDAAVLGGRGMVEALGTPRTVPQPWDGCGRSTGGPGGARLDRGRRSTVVVPKRSGSGGRRPRPSPNRTVPLVTRQSPPTSNTTWQFGIRGQRGWWIS